MASEWAWLGVTPLCVWQTQTVRLRLEAEVQSDLSQLSYLV